MLQEQVFKRIKIKLDKDKDFNYLLCNLFEASPNKINSIFQFYKLYLVLEYIKEEKIKNVYLINISNEIKISLIQISIIFLFHLKLLILKN